MLLLDVTKKKKKKKKVLLRQTIACYEIATRTYDFVMLFLVGNN